MKKSTVANIQFAFVLLLVIGINMLLVYFERGANGSSINNIWDSLWYMMVSLTTVGYGDKYPVTPEGKIIGYVFVIASVGLIGYLIGKFTSFFNRFMEMKKLGQYGTDFKNHVVIIDWNNYSQKVAKEIIQANKELAVVTNSKDDIDLINNLYGTKVFTLFADYENFGSLDKVNIRDASSVFVSFPDDTQSLVYVLNARKIYGNINLIVALQNSNLQDTFVSAGIEKTIPRDEITSRLVASYIFEPDVADLTEELMGTSNSELEYDIAEYKIIEPNKMIGKDYLDVFLELKKKFNSILMGISKNENGKYKLYKNPPEGIKIAKCDYLVIMSTGNIKKQLEKEFGVPEGRSE